MNTKHNLNRLLDSLLGLVYRLLRMYAGLMFTAARVFLALSALFVAMGVGQLKHVAFAAAFCGAHYGLVRALDWAYRLSRQALHQRFV